LLKLRLPFAVGVDADEGGIRLARRKVVIAGGLDRQTGGKVRPLLGRQETKLPPVNSRIRDALLPEPRREGDPWTQAGPLRQTVESGRQLVGRERGRPDLVRLRVPLRDQALRKSQGDLHGSL